MSTEILLRSDTQDTGDRDSVPGTLLAFSPDIVFIRNSESFDVRALSKTYSRFLSKPTLQGLSFDVWVRGKQVITPNDDSDSEEEEDPEELLPDEDSTDIAVEVTLRAFPNELVLWPQVWKDVETGAVVLNGLFENKVCTPSNAFSDFYSSEDVTGGTDRHLAFVANVAKDVLPSADPATSYADLVNGLGKDTSFATYNIMWAKTSASVITLKTRFRWFQPVGNTTKISLSVEGPSIPKKGVEAEFRLEDDKGVTVKDSEHIKAAFDPDAAPDDKPSTTFTITTSTFDGFAYLTIYNQGNAKVDFSANAHISFIAEVVDNGAKVLVGIEHISFAVHPEPWGAKPDAFYFRTKVGDTKVVPRVGTASASPDIQFLGQTPVGDPTTSLSKFDTDYSKGSFVDGIPNFIYVRGTATQAIQGKIRVWAVPSSLLYNPSQYGTASGMIPAVRFDLAKGIRTAQYAPISTDGPGEVVCSFPFVMVDAPNGVYDLIAEYRPDPSADEMDPQWPSDKAGMVAMSSADFTTWVLKQRCLAWRKVGWTANVDKPSFRILQAFTRGDDETFTTRTVFALTLKTNFPIGSEVSMQAFVTAGTALPLDRTKPLVYTKKVVEVDDEALDDMDITGLSEDAEITVYAWWYSKGKTATNKQYLEVGLDYVADEPDEPDEPDEKHGVDANAKRFVKKIAKEPKPVAHAMGMWVQPSVSGKVFKDKHAAKRFVVAKSRMFYSGDGK